MIIIRKNISKFRFRIKQQNSKFHSKFTLSSTGNLGFFLKIIVLSGLLNNNAWSQNAYSEQKKLIDLSLDELLNIKITSVSKKSQKASEAAAAIFVITQRDIKRSGVTTIPDALRMAPGIDVAKIDSNKWAISARGFTSRFSNKLLVLIDGRSVYTPFFSGVYWDEQDTLLEDIDRIEVIRGSGASLWGANAVNGVINIITKQARDTQGAYLAAGGGTKERVFGEMRYGGKINEDSHYRLYAKYFERENNSDYREQAINDDWRMGRGGFRIDSQLNKTNQLTFQGDIYQGNSGESLIMPNIAELKNELIHDDNHLLGGNALVRWSHQINETDDAQLQLYYDYADRETPWVKHKHNTLDLDFQHNFSLWQDHEVIWGLGYRFINDDIGKSAVIIPNPNQRNVHLFSLFFQDEMTLIDKELKLTFGSKFEHNDFSGFEIQPSIRATWTPNQTNSVWGGISRSVRTPARGERGTQINTPFNFDNGKPVFSSINAEVGRNSEELIAYELGYRFRSGSTFSSDLALFYNDYDNLRSIQPGAPIDMGAYIAQPMAFSNNMTSESYGAELSLNWQVLKKWRLNSHYAYQNIELHIKNAVNLSEHEEFHGFNHKFSLQSSLQVTRSLDWDLWLKYSKTDNLNHHLNNLLSNEINDLLTLDSRVAWRPHEGVEIAVIGQNLLSSKQLEYFSDFIASVSGQMERSVYAKVTWSF